MTKSRTKTLIFTTLDTSLLKKIDDCESIYNANPLYLRIGHASGYIEEKIGDKYFRDKYKKILILLMKTKKY